MVKNIPLGYAQANMKNVDISLLQNSIGIGKSFPSEIGSLFASNEILGTALIVLYIIFSKHVPLGRFIKWIVSDTKKSLAEPPMLEALASLPTRLKIYHGVLVGYWFSIFVYALLSFCSFSLAAGVWVMPVVPNINQVGVSVSASAVGCICLFFLWVQTLHSNQLGRLILRKRKVK